MRTSQRNLHHQLLRPGINRDGAARVAACAMACTNSAPTSFADRRITSTKFSNSDPPRVRFISDNPLYKPYEGSGEEVNIIGRTVGSPGKCEPSSK